MTSLIAADEFLKIMPRISDYSQKDDYNCQVFLLPKDVSYVIDENSCITTSGLGENWDNKSRDLLTIIEIENAYEMKYRLTNVLTPLVYAESRPEILWHITTQGLFFTKVSEKIIAWIKHENSLHYYNKHDMDHIWLPCCKPLETIHAGDTLCIFNRRVDGWDGSSDRPVIELLGAGGHLPTVWDEKGKAFRCLSFKENLLKEANEELGICLEEKDIELFGGYENLITHELVVLGGVELDCELLPGIQDYAFSGNDPDTRGIYIGTFRETIEEYYRNPGPFAGGAKAAQSNFPNQRQLMDAVLNYLDSK